MEKFAIVTGVASGIGECISNNLLKEGVYVFGIDINQPKNNQIDFFECDIRDEEKIIKIKDIISKKTNHIDLLVNCAGIFCENERGFIQDISKKEWQEVIDVNLTGTFLITKYFIPLIKESNNGLIVNLSSEQVVLPQMKSAPYAITKAGIEMFSKILAFELMEDKVRVNTIALASVRTNFIKKYKKDQKLFDEMMEKTNKSMPFGIIESDDVFKLVKYMMDEDNKITGQTILIDSGVVLNVNRKK